MIHWREHSSNVLSVDFLQLARPHLLPGKRTKTGGNACSQFSNQDALMAMEYAGPVRERYLSRRLITDDNKGTEWMEPTHN